MRETLRGSNTETPKRTLAEGARELLLLGEAVGGLAFVAALKIAATNPDAENIVVASAAGGISAGSLIVDKVLWRKAPNLREASPQSTLQ